MRIKVWPKIAYATRKFNEQILLGAMFFLMFVPIGLIMRFLGKDPMRRRFSKKNSYWEPCELAGLKNKGCYERLF